MTESSSSSSTAPAAPLNSLRIERGAGGPGRRAWGRWALAGLVLAGAAWWWMGPRPITVQAVSVVTATASQQHVALTASGYVVAQRRAAVASKATGRLVELNVREGSRVKAGELLARIDASDVQASLVAAEAGVRQAEAGVRQAEVEQLLARAELARSQGLQAQGFISPQALDAVQSRLKGAQAAVVAARATVAAAQAQVKVQEVARSFTEIRAPFDGVVLVKNANVGDVITPLSSAAGTQGAVVTMADLSTLEVEADVSESSLAQVRQGQPVEVLLDALPGVRFLGQVGAIVPTVDRAKATVTTKVRFDQLDARILPEMSAKVNFLKQPITAADQQPLLAVPAQAIDRQPAAARVWRLQPVAGTTDRFTAQAVPVTPGRTLGELVELRLAAGGPQPPLKAGDRLAVPPAGNALHDGAAVRLSQP